MELEESRRLLGACRLYVCPHDYLVFADSERRRWKPIEAARAPQPSERLPDVPPPPEPSCTADQLIELLGHRGLAGWAFLVRDVAAGRVRRLHLRQLPADPEIRRALMTYLQSAGTAVTVSHSFLKQQRRSLGG